MPAKFTLVLSHDIAGCDYTDAMTNAVITPYKAHRWRAAILVLLTLCLHILVIDWGATQLAAMDHRGKKDKVVNVALREIARPTEPVKLPVAAPPSSSQKATKKTSPKPPVLNDHSSRLSMNDAVPVPAEEPAVADEAPDDGVPGPTTATNAQTDARSTAQGTYYHVATPPSVAVSYDVEAIQGTLTYRAMGTITWKTDGQHYTIRGEATSLFMTLLGFDSEGSINTYGVSPSRYTEQRFRKPPTMTYLDSERHEIHFSSSDVTYPLIGGEQDRASLVWQLASIGRGDATQFTAGAVIDLFVAGVRDGEVWRVQVIGQEDLSTAIGHIPTWHVVRQPKIGSYDQRIDIWFAPDHGWTPVKLRYTEPNNDFLDMSVTSIKLLQ